MVYKNWFMTDLGIDFFFQKVANAKFLLAFYSKMEDA